MTGRRPASLKPPAHLSRSPPVPQPAASDPGPAKPISESGGPKGEEPTRYGDWENSGICWDF